MSASFGYAVRFPARTCFAWILPFVSPACNLLGGCPDVGCGPELSAKVISNAGALPHGDYTLTLRIDGELSECAFSVPNELPDGGIQSPFVECGTIFRLQVADRQECVTRVMGEFASPDCTPIPNTTELTFLLLRAPDILDIELRRGGEVVLDQEVEPTYTQVDRAGPGCGSCTQGEVELRVE